MATSLFSARVRAPALAAPALLFFACAPDDRGVGATPDAAAPTADEACNPLGEQNCLLPWPSSAYLEDDADTETGVRVALPSGAMPEDRAGQPIDTAPYNRRDGFSASGPILAAFPTGVSDRGLPGPDDIGASLGADSPVLVVNMETGEPHPIFAEVDANALSSVPRRPLIIRPAERLEPGARYAVGIRDTVQTPEGDPVPAPPAFRRIRDGDAGDHPRAASPERYDEVFAALGGAGAPREELALAWDFVTASDASLTSDLRAMREAALAYVEDAGSLSYELEEVEAESERVYRKVVGRYETPNFLTAGEEDDSVLVRENGVPAREGSAEARLAAVIPACAEDASEPLPVTLFGHGLMASAEQHLRFEEIHAFADDDCRVLIGGDWIGFTERQAHITPQVAGDLDRLSWITEKLAQSVVNFIVLRRAVEGALREAELFQVNGEPILDEGDVSYFGISLGGIMGGVLVGYDPGIERAVLGVGGAPWGLLLERSLYWGALQGTLVNAYGDQLSYQVAVALTNMAFEPYDPITTAPGLTRDPITGRPPAQVFLYAAVGDSLVANEATAALARTADVPVTAPSVPAPWGLDEVEGSAPSALTIYDEAPEPMPPEGNVPPGEDNGTHVTVNFLGAVIRQVEHFLAEGQVRTECRDELGAPAPCACQEGWCE